MKKITVVGGGNAGCFTALYCAWMDNQKDFEVELIYDPEIPPERVGQATILEASACCGILLDLIGMIIRFMPQ